ncbi:MAG TPA: hypothetical protein VID27_18075 [Blastocatellia bacterium]
MSNERVEFIAISTIITTTSPATIKAKASVVIRNMKSSFRSDTPNHAAEKGRGLGGDIP